MQRQNPNDKINQLRMLSTLLDSKFKAPFGLRFGLDAILGLIPVVGDLVTTGMSIFILAKASELGCSTSTLIRMAANIAVENIIDMIPFFGNVFDFFWKANNRNMKILDQHVTNPNQTRLQSRIVVIILILVLIALLALTGYAAFLIFEWLFHFFSGSTDSWSI